MTDPRNKKTVTEALTTIRKALSRAIACVDADRDRISYLVGGPLPDADEEATAETLAMIGACWPALDVLHEVNPDDMLYLVVYRWKTDTYNSGTYTMASKKLDTIKQVLIDWVNTDFSEEYGICLNTKNVADLEERVADPNGFEFSFYRGHIDGNFNEIGWEDMEDF